MTEHVLNLQTKGPISEPKAAPATRKTQPRPGSNCFFVQKEIFECFGRDARAFDNVTKVTGPSTLKK